jgi:hypothetical protein
MLFITDLDWGHIHTIKDTMQRLKGSIGTAIVHKNNFNSTGLCKLPDNWNEFILQFGDIVGFIEARNYD